MHVEADAVDDVHPAVPGLEADGEVLHGEDGPAGGQGASRERRRAAASVDPGSSRTSPLRAREPPWSPAIAFAATSRATGAAHASNTLGEDAQRQYGDQHQQTPGRPSPTNHRSAPCSCRPR